MPIYEFRCRICGLEGETRRAVGDTLPPACPDCGAVMVRRYSPPSFRMPLPDHFNVAAGTYVSGEKQLKDRFKIMSEEATLRTGIEHKFVPVDPADQKSEFGITDEGLDETYRRRSEAGMVEVKRWL